MSVEFVRSVSRKYSQRTACGLDGFHMRHYSWMSDDCLETICYIMYIMELCSTLPAQLQVVQLALLMKPSGGRGPIGLFCSIYRLWGRCRRRYALQWELQYQRSFYA
eukprot:80080-Pyramimonas_sp.AAC.1